MGSIRCSGTASEIQLNELYAEKGQVQIREGVFVVDPQLRLRLFPGTPRTPTPCLHSMR